MIPLNIQSYYSNKKLSYKNKIIHLSHLPNVKSLVLHFR